MTIYSNYNYQPKVNHMKKIILILSFAVAITPGGARSGATRCGHI